jgi:hypothetical protein
MNSSAAARCAAAVGDGLDALRAAASAHVPQTREEKLVMALAQLEANERSNLRGFEAARTQGEGSSNARLWKMQPAVSAAWPMAARAPLPLGLQATALEWTGGRAAG